MPAVDEIDFLRHGKSCLKKSGNKKWAVTFESIEFPVQCGGLLNEADHVDLIPGLSVRMITGARYSMAPHFRKSIGA